MSKFKSGFVYVLENAVMPGIIKVGKTTDIHRRVKQLSGATSCPIPFTVSALWYCPNAGVIERILHHSLEDQRINTRREFFRAEVSSVEGKIATLMGLDAFSYITRIDVSGIEGKV